MLKRFPSNSIGLAETRDSLCVVCVRDGTTLMLRSVPELLQRDIGILEADIPATFYERKIPGTVYRDGLLFENGRFVLFQQLVEEALIDVINVPGQTQTELPEFASDDIPSEEELENEQAGVLVGIGMTTLVAGVSACWVLGFVTSLVT